MHTPEAHNNTAVRGITDKVAGGMAAYEVAARCVSFSDKEMRLAIKAHIRSLSYGMCCINEERN